MANLIIMNKNILYETLQMINKMKYVYFLKLITKITDDSNQKGSRPGHKSYL